MAARRRSRACARCRGCRSASCTTRAAWSGCSRDLSINVTAMFRDPGFHRALREKRRPAAAHLSVRPHLERGLLDGRGGRLARDRAARGGPARAHAHLRDRHHAAVLARARAGAFPLEQHAATTRENYLRAGGDRGVLAPTTRSRGDAAVLRPGAAARRRLRPAQPGLRPLVQRVPPDPVPQRADLLRARAAGPRARAVPRQPVPLRRPRRSGRKETIARHRDRGRATSRSSTPRRSTGDGMMRVRARRHRRLLGRPARARGACSAALPRRLRRADRSSSSTAAERRRRALLADAADRARRAAGARGRGQGRRCEPGTRARRAGRLPPARRARATSRCRPTSRGRASAARRSTCSSRRPPTRYGAAAVGVVLTGANDDGAAGLARDRAAAAASRSSRTPRPPSAPRCRAAAHRGGAGRAGPRRSRRSRPLLVRARRAPTRGRRRA